ncbi:Ig-like domain-containing protein [Coprococcus sp. HCN-4056]|uniref:Ig-like domain-containing protein n=1 Tax=Coprococcus sp. HCN-4056 TaxID=3134671 RepID=UPI0030BD42DA
MKKQMKVIAMLIIAVAVMLGCSIGSPVKWKAQAAETVVPEGYEPISSADQLNGIRNNLSGKYILTEDIDLTEYTKEGGIFDTGNGWTPIDNFTGTFDGNGHRIIGMHIYGKIDTVGLFGTVSGATIKNLSLTDVDIEMNTNYGDYTGALVGTCGNNTQISGIYVDGLISVSDGGACLGGIIGRIWNAEQNIVQNCINNCSVSNSYSGYLGGIVGRSYSGYANSVTNCYTRGNLQQADDGYYKPIMGSYNYNDEIKNCYYDPKSLMESKRNTQYNNATPLTEAMMKYSSSYVGFDFKNVWFLDEYSSYPYAQLRSNPTVRVKSLMIKQLPTKQEYFQGDKLSLNGFSLYAVYEDELDALMIPSESMLGSYNMNKIGTQTITVSLGGKSVSFSILVKEIPPTSIKLNVSSANIQKGKTQTLKATVLPAKATYKTVTWSSQNPAIATVDANGVVKAKKAGSTVITAKTKNGLTARCIVNVKVPAVKVYLDRSEDTVEQGKKITLKATISPLDSTDIVYWGSADETVAVVSGKGVVTAKKAGTTKIYAITDSGAYKTYTITVKASVKNKAIELKNLTAQKNKKAKVKYSSVKGATGYQIQYATKKSFKGAKTKTVTKTTANLTGLKAGKRYYVRVRAKGKASGKTVYSKWSNVMSVKAKK